VVAANDPISYRLEPAPAAGTSLTKSHLTSAERSERAIRARIRPMTWPGSG
jgi:hypothetical protein